MFADTPRLTRIGKIEINSLISCNDMFANSADLKTICTFMIPANANGNRMFANTTLGKRVYGENGEALFARLTLLQSF